MRKAWSIAAAAVLTASVLGGCGNQAVNGTGTAAQKEGTSETAQEKSDGQEADSEQAGERETLVVGVPAQNFVTDYKDNYLTKLLEEELNVNLEFYEFPADGSDLQSKFSLMASSGEGLPDVMMYKSFSPETVLDYGTKGVFLPLNDYYEKTDTYYSQLPEEHKKTIETAIRSADGNIYALPNFSENVWNYTPNRIFINTVWLDKLGLEIPTTLDELHDVLTAFVNEDPNGNGKKDEIGLYGMVGGGYGQDIVDTILNAFVFYNGGSQNGGLALDESGETVMAPFTTEEWREGLEYLNQLYNEGLIASSIFTDDDTQFKATLNAETNVVGMVCAGSTSNWTDCDNNVNFLEMSMIEPLTGPEGICYTPYTEIAPACNFFITSACENPDLAFQLGDWFMTKEHSRYGRYGEKGIDWTDEKEICDANTNAYVEADVIDSVDCVWMTNIWSEPSNKFWYNINPYYAPLEAEMSVANGVNPFDESSKSGMLYAYNLEWYNDKHPEKTLPLLHYTAEESTECAEIMVNVKELVTQAKAEFITGARSLETDWEAYVQQLENAGLSRWMELAQEAYERI